MALNYLLSPEFQIVNSAGRPASGGYLTVFYHGTRDRYYCASDFDGTLHPFQVPLDSLGGNVVLADDSHAYDVYIYNRYGSLLMSRYNIHPSSGGSMGGVITSSDGSVTVTPTQDGWDLSVDDGKAATFRAAADSLSADGYFSFRKIEGEGDAIYLDNGQIKMDDGWYHFSATVKLTWYGSNVNDTSTVRLYSGATYDVIDFDYSYNHSDTVVLDGDIWIGAHSTHYISFGRNFSLGVTGMRQGMVAELVDCDLHSILGQGVGGNGEKNIHRLLRYYTNESEADAQHPVGDWLHDLDAEDPSDPSGHPMVTADQLFEWYDEGQIFELYEVDGSNGQLGWSAVYRMVTWQDQSDWWSQFAPVPGKACRLEFYRMGGYSSINRGMMIAYIRYKEEDYMRLYQIMPGQDVWTMDFQPELTAGSNISISGSTISATDTTYTAGTGLSLTGTEFSADTSVLATKSDLAGKQDVLTAGQNITIDSSNVISATDTTYTAGTGIDITGTTISADTSVVATQNDLAGKQDTLTAGTGITIQNNVISATSSQQVQSNWNETDTADPSYIQNKPDLSIYAESADLATVATTGDYDDLIDKPDLSVYAETSDLATVATTGDYDDLVNKPTIPSFDSNQMAAINSGVNSTKVGNYDTHIADTTIHVTSTDKTNWNAKENASNKAQTLDPTSTTEFPSSAATANFVNSSVASATANFLGNYELADLGLTYPATTYQIETALDGYTFSTTPTNNDYVYVEVKNPQTTGIDDEVQRYKFNGTSWLYEYTLNNSSFTAAEKAAIDSGIDSAKVAVYDAHVADSDIHVTTSDKSTWNAKQDAISDLSTIRSGAQAGSTAVQPGDLATVATTGDYDDLIDKPDLSVYAETADLATVATTGSYNDLTNKPTIPSAQVNSDWNASSGVAQILNKPDLSVYATQSDLNGKQDTLTAGSNISISNNVISATDTTYSAGTGLTLTGTTFSNADPLPSHTSSDSGKVLGVDSNGDLEWTAGGGAGGADWDATSGEPGYIENKPTPKVLTAGTNISISETASALTISATAAPQVQSDWAESDSTDVSYIQNKPVEKTLAAGSGITLSEANDVVTVAATPYTAGTGISISNNVISADETVLWENYTFANNKSSSVVMTETPFNFSCIRITFEIEASTETWPTVQTQIIDMVALNSCVNKYFTLNGTCVNGSVIYARCSKCHFNGTAISDDSSVQWYNGNNSAAMTGPLHIYRIVGVNRIASN